ncbi:MAG: hypothetical protein PUJ84_03155 [Mollicutes bacterium]|nr:hypothetical protein [Mollicutes bacterium]
MGKLDKESYLGKKYHFRYYRKSGNHPFLVAIVIESELEDGKAILSGFNMTRSIEMVLNNPTKFIRITNPNPNDDAPSFVCVDPIKDKPLKLFTRPIRDWELTSADEKAIDRLVKEKLSD